MTYCIFSYVCKTEMMVTNTAPPFIHFICDLLTISSNILSIFSRNSEANVRREDSNVFSIPHGYSSLQHKTLISNTFQND